MRIELAAFTGRGERLGKRLADGLATPGVIATLERLGSGGRSLREWVDGHFDGADALVFIGATGIAVRAVAPRIVSKTTDPAVVVVDEFAKFAVSLLSGHLGGANALAIRIAGILGAVPVVTTATDGNNVFAVDVWAKNSGMAILNPEAIKNISAALLAGKTVRINSAFPVAGTPPDGVSLMDGDGDVFIDVRQSNDSRALHLAPPVSVLGVGCRKGITVDTVDEVFAAFCRTTGIVPQAFRKVCSIDLKKDEPGLRAFCDRRRLPFETFSAEALKAVPGAFSTSEFVLSVTGVDNVCERSAVLGSGGRLAAPKFAASGVAMAAALADYVVSF